LSTASSVKQTNDCGYIFAGRTFVDTTGKGKDAYLLKVDGFGNFQWVKTYDGGVNEVPQFVQKTDDGGYIFAGLSYVGLSTSNFLVMKVDKNGLVEWERVYGGDEEDRAQEVQQTNDGGYVVTGFTESFGSLGCCGEWDVWLIKLDEFGDMEWNETYGGAGSQHAWEVHQTSDEGYILGGQTLSPPFDYNLFLIKTDSNGSEEWNNTFNNLEEDIARSIKPTLDGGYVLAGHTGSFGGVDGRDAYLLKIDSEGNIMWDKTYGKNYLFERAFEVVATQDGGYVLGGSQGTQPVTDSEQFFYSVKTDSEGNI
jgi:hypothetical protein